MKTHLLEINIHIALVCNILDIHQNHGPCFKYRERAQTKVSGLNTKPKEGT